MTKKRKPRLLLRLLAGIVLGSVLGSLGGLFGIADTAVFSGFVSLFVTFTSLFSTFISFIIPLLIVSFVAVGLAELGEKANKLFGVTLILAYASTVLAGLLAYLGGSALLPAIISPIAGSDIAARTYDALFTIEVAPICGVMTALVLAFILGLGMANSKSQALLQVMRDLQHIVSLVLTKVIIPVIPVYIAGLFCNIAATGRLLPTILMFLKLYVMILLFQWGYICVQFAVASLYTRENKFKNLKNILPAYFTALGTQSSAATIPVNLQCGLKNGLREDVAGFVIPLCATIHLAGDTICLVLGAMGIMLANGIVPSLSVFLPFILMLGVTMVAAPGVPGGGVMAALGLITSMLGFTEPMQQLIISLHFSQDSFGTACNITGDQAIAAMVNRLDERNEKKHSQEQA